MLNCCYCACRCGAGKATAVESVRHMADTANHVVALNGFNNKIKVVHKDARYLSSDSSGVDTPADLMVFEVCEDEGLCHRVISRILQRVVAMHCMSTTTAPTVSFRHHALQIKSKASPRKYAALARCDALKVSLACLE